MKSPERSGRLPSTRMGTASLLRTAFAQAQAYGRKKEAAKETPINLKLEALNRALQKKIPVIFAACDRRRAGPSLPPSGLHLVGVDY